jgi:PAS domain S-box-containing protein
MKQTERTALEERIRALEKELEERKRDTEALFAEKEKINRFLDQIPQPVYEMNRERRITYANRKAFELFEETQEDFDSGIDALDLIAPEDRKRAAKNMRMVMEGTPRSGSEYMALKKGGERLPVVIYSVPVITGEKTPGLRGIIVDITDLRRAEDALHESETRFGILIDSVPGISIQGYDTDGIVRYWNAASEGVYGYTAEEAVGRNLGDLIIPKDILPLFHQCLATGKIISHSGEFMPPGELLLLHKDGSRVPVYSIHTAVCMENRETLLFCIDMDLSEQKRVQDELRHHSERALHLQKVLFDIAKGGFPDTPSAVGRIMEIVAEALEVERTSVWWFTPDRTAIVCEELFTRSVGTHESGAALSVEECPSYFEAVGMSRFIAVEDCASDPRTREFAPYYCEPMGISSLLDVPIWLHGEFVGVVCHEHKGPRRIWTTEEQQFAASVADIIALAREGAERRQAEQALRSSEQMFRSIVEKSMDGITVVDEDGRIIEWNPGVESISGIPREEAVGSPLWEVMYRTTRETKRTPGRMEIYEKRLKEVLRSGVVPTALQFMEVSMHREDGGRRIIQEVVSPVHTARGCMLIVTTRDVTPLKQMEEERLKAGKLESVGLLAGGIAHDFNNILVSILGNISLAKSYLSPSNPAADLLVRAERAGTMARDLTRQLLTFSKGGAPIKETASMEEIIRESAEFSLLGSDVRCEFTFEPDLRPAEVDRGQMIQVLNNLILNADQAMPEGGVILLRAENITTAGEDGLPLEDGEYLRIVVSDQGIGIPAENLQKIFDPYFTTKEEGSGLGLATSYSIIKNHGGHIRVESVEGDGATFFVYLPAAAAGEGGGAAAVDFWPDRRGKILVMDDEDGVRVVASEMLKHLGHEVKTACDGAEAVRLYREASERGKPFDAVIVDLTVPGGVGGLAMMRELTEFDPGCRAIVSSGYSGEGILSDYEDYGFAGVIAKPYRMEELRDAVNRVLAGNQPGGKP